MRLSFKVERVLAVVAHPDDADLLCAGTLARARGDGAAVAIYVLCQGDKGKPEGKSADLAARRRKEMAASAELLQAGLFTANIPDGTLTDSVRTRRGLIEIFRRFKPTLILAHAPEDYHPDHRAASSLSEAASWFCASNGHRTRSAALPSPPAVWWMDCLSMHGFAPGFYINISEFVSLKTRM